MLGVKILSSFIVQIIAFIFLCRKKKQLKRILKQRKVKNKKMRMVIQRIILSSCKASLLQVSLENPKMIVVSKILFQCRYE